VGLGIFRINDQRPSGGPHGQIRQGGGRVIPHPRVPPLKHVRHPVGARQTLDPGAGLGQQRLE
jgi:hypothetical protein